MHPSSPGSGPAGAPGSPSRRAARTRPSRRACARGCSSTRAGRASTRGASRAPRRAARARRGSARAIGATYPGDSSAVSRIAPVCAGMQNGGHERADDRGDARRGEQVAGADAAEAPGLGERAQHGDVRVRARERTRVGAGERVVRLVDDEERSRARAPARERAPRRPPRTAARWARAGSGRTARPGAASIAARSASVGSANSVAERDRAVGRARRGRAALVVRERRGGIEHRRAPPARARARAGSSPARRRSPLRASPRGARSRRGRPPRAARGSGSRSSSRAGRGRGP